MKNAMIRATAAVALGLALLGLSGCAHKDLTAPCSRDSSLWSFGSAFAAAIDCGPLLPVNQ